MTYVNKVKDPLFNATVPVELRGTDSKGGRPLRTLYFASKVARALACQEQVSQQYSFIYEAIVDLFTVPILLQIAFGQ